MYEFSDTDEQRQLREMVRDFSEKEIAPYVREWDDASMFPADFNRKLARIGLLGGAVPTEYGGSGMDYVSLSILIEELSRFSPMAGSLCGHPSCSLGMGLIHYGTDAQREEYLRPTVNAERIGGAAVTEPHSGTDVVRNMETVAERRGDDYVLRGQKTWVSNLGLADWFITFATIDKSLGHKGVCAFLVDADSPGLSTNRFTDNVGCRTFMSGEVVLDDVVIPKRNLLGEPGQGYKVLMAGTEIGRLACASRAIGMHGAVLDLSRAYARTREVYQQPIGRYQMVQKMIAEMATSLDAGRFLTYRLAWLKDRGVERCQREAAIAKHYTTDALMVAATDGMQIHGAYSCSGEYEIGRIWRDAKFMQIYDGVNEIQKVMIAEHELGYRDPRSQASNA